MRWVGGLYFFYFFNCFDQQNSPEKKTFNTLNLNCQTEYVINIKCLNKTIFFFKYAGKENRTQKNQPVYKQIKNLGGRCFWKMVIGDLCILSLFPNSFYKFNNSCKILCICNKGSIHVRSSFFAHFKRWTPLPLQLCCIHPIWANWCQENVPLLWWTTAEGLIRRHSGEKE